MTAYPRPGPSRVVDVPSLPPGFPGVVDLVSRFVCDEAEAGRKRGEPEELVRVFLTEKARRSLDPSGALLWSFLFSTFLPWRSIALLIAAGILAGLFGSWISVREWTEETATIAP